MAHKGFNISSIRTKLLILQFIVTATALIVVFAVMLVFQYQSALTDIENDLNAQAEILKSNLSASVAFEDKKTADEILSSLRLVPSINRAEIYLYNGGRFSQYAKEANPHAPDIRIPYTGLHRMNRRYELVLEQKPLAILYIEINLNKLNARLGLFALVVVMAGLLAMLAARLIAARLNLLITEPLSSLTRFVSRVSAEQNYGLRTNMARRDEFGTLAKGIDGMLVSLYNHGKRLEDELSQRKLAEEQLDKLAYYDTVTHLPNRHFFNEQLALMLEHAAQRQQSCYLMFIDLDNFKSVNDTLGHLAGDSLLREAGSRILQTLVPGSILCRIGGDEFAIILRDQPLSAIDATAGAIIALFSEKFVINAHEVFVGASIGISNFPADADHVSGLLRNADTAMYWAKADGKNTFRYYSRELEDSAHQQEKLMSMLQKALPGHELKLYYQPIIALESRKIVGFEALLRWYQPELGNIRPDIFIPLAESSGLIMQIGEWVLETACQQAKAWQKSYASNLIMNVNFSGRQFHHPNIVQNIVNTVNKVGLDARLLNIELTESVLMDQSSEMIEKMHMLRQAGLDIAIDDFGTGYSSMSYLRQFPINTIKIDRSFIKGLPDDPEGSAIAQAILALAKTLKLSAVAEGVETQAQADFLRANGCEKIQGYLFSEPVKAEEAERLICQQLGRDMPEKSA
jgi:diguanylate cyclase